MAGLVAGMMLKEAGHQVTILEVSNYPIETFCNCL
ncbi:hypothetical protein [Polycladomyces subterraneus]